MDIIYTGDVVLLTGSGDVTENGESNTAAGTVTDTPGGEFGYGGEQGGEGDAPGFFDMDDF